MRYFRMGVLHYLLVTVRRHKYLFFKGLARVATSAGRDPGRFMLTRVLTSV